MKDQTKRILANTLVATGFVLIGFGIGWTTCDLKPAALVPTTPVQDTVLVEETEPTLHDHVAMIVPEKLQAICKAIIWVESRDNPKAYRESGNCMGILQITPIYVKECNRLQSNVTYTLEDRTDIVKSLEMFTIIQNHHNPEHDLERAIQLHNPTAGPEYGDKVKARLNTIY